MLQRAVALASAVGLCVAIALCQQPSEPAFEVASVKASPAGATGKKGSGREPDPGMFTWHNRPLRSLIVYAFGITDDQLTGGPAWLGEARYDIDARPPGPATDEQKLAMVRTLLADRFQLKKHKETRTIESLAMTIAKGGPKFGPQFHKTDEEGLRAEMEKTNNSVVFMGGSMKDFALLLRMNMRTAHPADSPFGGNPPPIADQTGLEGLYYIAMRHPGPLGDFAAEAEAELGLKLTLRKTPVEMLVIDSIARPSEN